MPYDPSKPRSATRRPHVRVAVWRCFKPRLPVPLKRPVDEALVGIGLGRPLCCLTGTGGEKPSWDGVFLTVRQAMPSSRAIIPMESPFAYLCRTMLI
jgi:hypothetical protein